jgi:hypothetical protein
VLREGPSDVLTQDEIDVMTVPPRWAACLFETLPVDQFQLLSPEAGRARALTPLSRAPNL